MIWHLIVLAATASFSLSSDHLSLCDTLSLELVVTGEEGYEVDLDSVHAALDEMEPYFTVESEEVGPVTDLGNGQWEQRIVAQLEPWEAGEVGIAFLPLRLISRAHPPILLHTEWVAVEIGEPQGRGGDEGIELSPLPLESRAAHSMNRSNRERLEGQAREAMERHRRRLERSRSIVRLLLLLLGGATLFWLVRRVWRRLLPAGKSPLARIDPRGEALRRLEQLEAESLPGQGLVELYYVRVTEIVRLYLEAAYEVKAPERTTQEFLEELVALPQFDVQVRELLRAFLLEADLVKFARFEPTEEQCAAAVEAARRLILWEEPCAAALPAS